MSQPRALKIMSIEVMGLERLLATTAPTAPDRPALVRRLAEAYAELAASATESKTASMPTPAGVRPPRWQPPPPPDVDDVIVTAHRKAIEHYVSLLTHVSNGSTLDEVVYYLALEYERIDDVTSARAAYSDLIKRMPDSKYVPEAFFGLGESFYAPSKLDPRSGDEAISAYRSAMTTPPPGNRVYGLASYRIGCVLKNRGDVVNASAAFKRTLEYCAADPSFDQPSAYVAKLSDITNATATR